MRDDGKGFDEASGEPGFIVSAPRFPGNCVRINCADALDPLFTAAAGSSACRRASAAPRAAPA